MVWKCFLPLIFSFSLASLGCGGISQDDMRARALSNDDDEEEAVAPAPPVAEEPAAAEQTAEAAPSESPQANPVPTVPATAETPSQTSAATTTASVSSTPETTAAVSGGDFDSVATSSLKTPETTSNAGEAANSTPESEEDYLGPMPVLGSDPTNEENEALRLWFLRRQELESRAEQRAEEELRKKAEMERAKALAGNGAGETLIASVGDSVQTSGEVMQALFDRLTNPENLAPVELARVAQELAYTGKNKEALAYYHGWVLTSDKTDEIKEQIRWSPGLQRPLAAIHWGLGIQYEGAPQLVSTSDPIGKDNNIFANAPRRFTSGQLGTYVGELGDRMLFGLDTTIETGSLGKLFKPPADEASVHPTVALQWQVKPAGFNPESFGRGITFLGGGTRKELTYIGKHEGIDVLVVFDMNVKQPRSGPVVNITTVKLIDLMRGKELASTPALNNVKVRLARQDRTQKDPVEKAFEDLISYVDNSMQLTSVPSSLKEEHAQARVEALAATQPSNPLAVMSEMKFYHAQGLVGDATLYSGYKVLVGDTAAKKLITGSAGERVAAIAKYLPKVEPVK